MGILDKIKHKPVADVEEVKYKPIPKTNALAQREYEELTYQKYGIEKKHRVINK